MIVRAMDRSAQSFIAFTAFSFFCILVTFDLRPLFHIFLEERSIQLQCIAYKRRNWQWMMLYSMFIVAGPCFALSMIATTVELRACLRWCLSLSFLRVVTHWCFLYLQLRSVELLSNGAAYSLCPILRYNGKNHSNIYLAVYLFSCTR